MVQNLRRLEAKLLRKIPRAVERNLRIVLERYAEKIVALARRLAPYDDGVLHDSIGWTWGTDISDGAMSLGALASPDGVLVITIYAGSDDAFYARWQEFGTQAFAANPFFFPAYRLNRRGVRSAMTRAIKNGLKEGAR